MSRMAGLGRHRPWTGLALVVFAASVAGIPPTGGFFGKWFLVLGALEKKDWVLLSFFAATAVFNLVLFAKFLVFLYEHRAPSLSWSPVPGVFKAPLVLLAAGVLLFGIYHQALIHGYIEPALPKAFQNLPVPNVPFLGKQVE